MEFKEIFVCGIPYQLQILDDKQIIFVDRSGKNNLKSHKRIKIIKQNENILSLELFNALSEVPIDHISYAIKTAIRILKINNSICLLVTENKIKQLF
jgi:hypothetical protein